MTDHLLALADAGLAARSRARALVAIRGLFQHLVGERWLEADPTALIDAPRTARRLPGVLGEEAVAQADRAAAPTRRAAAATPR